MKKTKSVFAVIAAVLMLAFCFPAAAGAEGDEVSCYEVEIRSPKTLYMNFTVKMDNVFDPESKRTEDMGMVGFYYYAAIRIVNNTTDWELQYMGDVPIQWGGYCDYPLGFAMGETMSWTMTDTTLSCQTIEDIFKLVRPGGAFEGCVVAFCIEECGTVTAGNGYVDSLFDQTDFSKKLYANKPAKEGILDGAYVEMTDTFVSDDTSAEPESSSDDTSGTKADTDETKNTSAASGNISADASDTGKTPAGSENGNTWIYIAAAVIVIAGIAAAVIIVRKKK